MSYTYKFPRPNVTVDIVLAASPVGWRLKEVTSLRAESQILLIERRNEPFKGKLALPGGFMDMDETLKEAAYRELKEETGIDLKERGEELNFLGVYDALNRDPRGRTIGAVFYCFIKEPIEAIAGDDAAKAVWKPRKDLEGDLAFDHMEIIRDAYKTYED